jgi:hypothetical protein
MPQRRGDGGKPRCELIRRGEWEQQARPLSAPRMLHAEERRPMDSASGAFLSARSICR